MQHFSKIAAVKFGWGVAKKKVLFFVGIFLITFLIQSLLSGVQFLTQEEVLLVVASIIGIALKLILDLGFINVALKLHDKKEAKWDDLFNQYSLFWKYLGGSILYLFIMIAGFILLIIPGIIFATRFQYYSYLIVDKKLGPIKSLKESWQMTKGQTINLLLFGSLLAIINILGFLALVIGLLWTTPTTLVAQAYVFRKLQK